MLFLVFMQNLGEDPFLEINIFRAISSDLLVAVSSILTEYDI